MTRPFMLKKEHKNMDHFSEMIANNKIYTDNSTPDFAWLGQPHDFKETKEILFYIN